MSKRPGFGFDIENGKRAHTEKVVNKFVPAYLPNEMTAKIIKWGPQKRLERELDNVNILMRMERENFGDNAEGLVELARIRDEIENDLAEVKFTAKVSGLGGIK